MGYMPFGDRIETGLLSPHGASVDILGDAGIHAEIVRLADGTGMKLTGLERAMRVRRDRMPARAEPHLEILE